MIFAEYDYETDIRVKQEDARQDGIEIGLNRKAIETALNMLKHSIDLTTVAECTNLPLEQIKSIAKENNISLAQ